MNILALLLVVYQSWLTRRALKAADESLRLTRRAVHLEMLPRGNILIHVIGNIEDWRQRIDSQIVLVERVRLGDLEALKEAAANAEHRANGLIVKPMYESSPGWLQVVYEAGAQHYFHAWS